MKFTVQHVSRMGRMLRHGPGQAVHDPNMLQHGAKRFKKQPHQEKLTVRPVGRIGRMLPDYSGQPTHTLHMLRNPKKCFIVLVHEQNSLLRDSHGQLPGVGRSLTKRDLCSEKARIVRQPPE